MDYLTIAHCFEMLHRRSQNFLVYAARDFQLTYSEYVLVLNLYECEGRSQDEIAACMYVDKAVVTRLIASLEKKKFIYRRRDIQDQRIKRLYLTEFGREQQDFLENLPIRWIDTLTHDLEEEERIAMLTIFQKLANRAENANFNQI
jgi:DNA-binding MarR family transcriptional regulator